MISEKVTYLHCTMFSCNLFQGVMLLQEFPHSFSGPAGGISFPFEVNTGWFSLVQMWQTIVVEPSDQTRDSEWSASVALGVFMLQSRDISCNVFEGNRVLNSQLVRLAFNLSSVDQDSRIGCQTCKCHYDMIIQKAYFPNSSLLLEFSNGLLFNSKHDYVVASYANLK